MDTNTLVEALQLTLLDTAPYTIGAYQLGWRDFERGIYDPPQGYDGDWASYLSGYNDAWSEATGRKLLR